MSITVLSNRTEVEPYLPQVREAADSERRAFGFLPKPAYDEFAAQGRMIVAVDSDGKMAGYCLYGGAMPQGKVFQTWVAKQSRGQGIGRRLISEVVRRLEQSHYLSLRADVADDLSHANEFYESLGFETIIERPAKTAGRRLHIRVRELATPSLLELAADRADTICLPVALPQSGRIPLYVLDLNVLFDVARARARASSSGKVLGAGFENDIRLAVTAELVSELARNTIANGSDPILEFAASLPRLPSPPRATHRALVDELAPTIFATRAQGGGLTIQDKSDLTHLATAIIETATGFITSEKAILRAGDFLRREYGLDVLSPDTFGMTLEATAVEESPLEVLARGSGVKSHPVRDDDYEDAEAFLRQRNVPNAVRRATLASGTGTLPRRRYIVRVDGAVAAVASWEAPRAGTSARTLQVYVDEGGPAAPIASDFLIRRAVADAGPRPPSVFQLSVPAGQPSLRRAALANGFFRLRGPRSQTQVLQKVAMARAVIPDEWNSVREAVRAKAGVLLPAALPEFGDRASPVEVANEDGESVTLSLSDLERLLSPFLLALPGRRSAILPITQRYAEELFSGSMQPMLFAGREAALRSVRGYVGARGTYKTVPDEGLIFFYESGTGGGRKAVTAIARVTRKYLMDKESASRTLSEKAVMEAEEVEGLGRSAQVVITEFEDLMLFRNPVRLPDLRRLGCVDGANLVTARPLAHEQVVAMIRSGEPHA